MGIHIPFVFNNMKKNWPQFKPSLRESSSWLVVILRLVGSGITALFIYPRLGLHDVVSVRIENWVDPQ
ncbi:MAG: hypothetical protein WCR46_20905 [Deltaproteobacteria bacterium]